MVVSISQAQVFETIRDINWSEFSVHCWHNNHPVWQTVIIIPSPDLAFSHQIIWKIVKIIWTSQLTKLEISTQINNRMWDYWLHQHCHGGEFYVDHWTKVLVEAILQKKDILKFHVGSKWIGYYDLSTWSLVPLFEQPNLILQHFFPEKKLTQRNSRVLLSMHF